MKTILCLAAVVMCGCTSIRIDGTAASVDAKTGIPTTNSITARVTSLGNSKQAVEALKGVSGKQVSVGANGMSQETELAETIRAFGDVAGKLVEAGAKGAVKP